MENKTSNTLIIVATFIMAIMGAIMFYQNKTMTKMRELLEKVDTTTTVTVDTLYLEKEIKDTVPQTITQTIFKTDTVYRQVGDSIEATPLLITLKKKKSPILL